MLVLFIQKKKNNACSAEGREMGAKFVLSAISWY